MFTGVISDDLRALMRKESFHHDGLREIAALLPQSDTELHEWLTEAGSRSDEDAFTCGLCAAMMANRKLNASLLRFAFALRVPPWLVAWVAWRMEGDVTEALLSAIEQTLPMKITYALGLFVATAWWMEHRAGEELPKRILHYAREYAPRDLDSMDSAVLSAFATLAGPAAEKELARIRKDDRRFVVPNHRGKKKIYRIINGPVEPLLPDRLMIARALREPIRNAEGKIGANEKCPCGSGRKYKKCCGNRAVTALDKGSLLTIETKPEVDPHIGLTKQRLCTGVPSELLKLDPLRVPADLHAEYLLALGLTKQLDRLIEAFEKLGVPEHLVNIWDYMWPLVLDQWRPDLARKLFQAFPDAEEKTGEKLHAGLRLLMVGDDPAQFVQELESSVEGLLKSGDLDQLQKVIWTLLASPYRGLGILLARSALPIVEEKMVPGLFDGILAARAKMNLSPEDEFSDWMNQKALRKALEHETAAVQAAEETLQKRAAEARRVKEERAQLQREVTLLKKRQRAQQEAAPARSTPDEQTQTKLRETSAKLDQVQALAREKGEAELKARRELERLTRENEELRANANGAEQSGGDGDEEGHDDFEITGKQPLRPIAFPKDFRLKLVTFKPHVGRAAMNRLGRMAAGEAAAFEKLKAIVALPGVLEARIADRYRLFFSLTPNCVRVVDLIYRADLDKAIERFKITGLPPVATFD